MLKGHVAVNVRILVSLFREELNQLVQMGFHFQQVKHFIQQEQQPVDNQRSKYRCALCCGLDGTTAKSSQEQLARA